MKILKAFLFILFFVTIKSHSQVQVDKIVYKSKEHYITNTLPYHITGTFLPPDKKEPSTVLNDDGTGVIQYDDMTRKKINWGIECNWEGAAILKEGYNSASYTFWYRTEDSDEWMYSQFTIHFAKKKMFLMGERIKIYEDYNVQ